MPATKTRISQLDRDALERAMVRLKRVDRDNYRDCQDRLEEGEDFDSVAYRAAGWCQYHALGLMPWQTAPCRILPDGERRSVDEGGRLLLQRLLDAGLSRFEPDPLRALAEKQR
jgi:hypothetical protein